MNAASPRVDVHVHLAGVGTNGSGCWTSAAFRRRPTFRALRLLHGIGPRQLRHSVDQDWVDQIASMVRRSSLDAAVVLGFDGVYDRQGRFDPVASQMVVPPRWVFSACHQHRGLLLPGPSINPWRRGALDLLDEAIEAGAALIKWLPAAQDIDPSDRRLGPFYRKLADSGVPLLVHAGGGEATFREVRPELKELSLLEYPLGMGVKVICPHLGAPILYSGDANQIPLLLKMMQRHPQLWVDNSGMANPSRFVYLARLASDPLVRERVLHGSDFPVPSSAVYFSRRLHRRQVWAVERENNPLEKEVRLKLALGYPESSLTRAAQVLGNLPRWVGPSFAVQST